MDNTEYDDGGSGGPLDSIAISLGILSLLLLICIASYLCNRRFRGINQTGDQQAVSAAWNHHPSAKASYPKLVYSEVNKAGCSRTTTCSICLGDYEEADMLRLLPQCGHVFHLDCIDPWLLLYPTCPVCRSSPITPSSSPVASDPIAEVTPLAIAAVSV